MSEKVPQRALTAGRNAVVGVLHRHHVANLAAALRANAWAGSAAVLGLLGLKRSMTLRVSEVAVDTLLIHLATRASAVNGSGALRLWVRLQLQRWMNQIATSPW
jgi:hypothetical protein